MSESDAPWPVRDELLARAVAATPDQRAALTAELVLLLWDVKSPVGSTPGQFYVDFQSGRAYKIVTQRFGSDLLYSTVRDIAQQLSGMGNVALPRESTLRIDLLFEWMNHNIDRLLPWFDDVIPSEQHDFRENP
jgi:hypothetical protein